MSEGATLKAMGHSVCKARASEVQQLIDHTLDSDAAGGHAVEPVFDLERGFSRIVSTRDVVKITPAA